MLRPRFSAVAGERDARILGDHRTTARRRPSAPALSIASALTGLPQARKNTIAGSLTFRRGWRPRRGRPLPTSRATKTGTKMLVDRFDWLLDIHGPRSRPPVEERNPPFLQGDPARWAKSGTCSLTGAGGSWSEQQVPVVRIADEKGNARPRSPPRPNVPSMTAKVSGRPQQQRASFRRRLGVSRRTAPERRRR
jgi:hypothetical protein